MAFRLSIEDGPYVQTIEVRSGSLTVGKKPPAGLALSSPGLSERHAVFRQEGDRVEVRALPTKIGVRVNGERIEHMLLAVGDSAHVGWARVMVVEVTPETAPPPAAPDVPSSSPPLEFADAPATAAAATASVSLPPPLPPVSTGSPLSAGASVTAPAAAVAKPAIPRHRVEQDADFVVLSRRAVRALPWWGVSVALHALFFVLLYHFTKPESELDERPDSTFAVTLRQTPQHYDIENVPPIEPSRRGVEVQRPDLDVPMETDSLLPPSPNPKGNGGTAAPRADDALLLDEFGGNAAWTAPGGSTSIGVGAVGRVGSVAGSELDAIFGKDGAGRANAAAAGRINGDPFTRALVNGLKLRTNEKNVKVVKGDYDQGELVMNALGIRHGFVSGPEIAHDGIEPEVRVVFYNCTGRPASPQTCAELTRWVSDGGWLFTSDWGVKVVERAFPGYLHVLKEGAREVATADETITFTIAPGRHELLKGLPPEAETSRWWLEESSSPFVIDKPEAVEVLAQSTDLERKYNSKYVAITFAHGKGRVVHVLGHMFQKEGNLRGAYAMQRLLINFLYLAIKGK